jgi:hypothetical protein
MVALIIDLLSCNGRLCVVHWMKNEFEKCVKQDAAPNVARKLESQLSLTLSLLAVLILSWLVAPMPVNAAGSSDKKDSVTVVQTKSPKVPTVHQSARKLVVSEKKGLLSRKVSWAKAMQRYWSQQEKLITLWLPLY